MLCLVGTCKIDWCCYQGLCMLHQCSMEMKRPWDRDGDRKFVRREKRGNIDDTVNKSEPNKVRVRVRMKQIHILHRGINFLNNFSELTECLLWPKLLRKFFLFYRNLKDLYNSRDARSCPDLYLLLDCLQLLLLHL